ncbi:hypothetical protein PWT90_10305 [Aphanocladium album]|nr:hypothetical protein PWT90_10305 [Aphanocladium album]
MLPAARLLTSAGLLLAVLDSCLTVMRYVQAAELSNGNLDADVLARQEARQGLAVFGFEVEADDAVRHVLPPRHDKVAPVLPGAGLVVELALAADEDVGELPVRGRPGGGDLVRQPVAEDLGERADEVLADNGVLLGFDKQRGVLVGDALDGVRQPGQVVDAAGVGEDGRGEGGLLRARGLVAQRELGPQLRVRGEHVGVKGARDGFAVLLEDGRRRLDNVDLGLREGHGGGGGGVKGGGCVGGKKTQGVGYGDASGNKRTQRDGKRTSSVGRDSASKGTAAGTNDGGPKGDYMTGLPPEV